MEACGSRTFSLKNRPFKVMVCVITLVAFLFTIVPPDMAWALTTDYSAAPAAVDINKITFPQGLAAIKGSWQSPNPRSTIIHIQDAHCNYYAQKRIADIIKYLNDNYGITAVNLEGGTRDYDLSLFTGIKDKAVREKASDHFVREGILNGAEYFAAINPEKISLWGIEDTKLYIENLQAYRESLTYKADADKSLKSLNYALSNLKTKIYSKELLELDRKESAYKEKAVELKDYVAYLINLSKSHSIEISDLENIGILNRTISLDPGINFKRANIERDELIDRLTKALSRIEVKELVEKAVEFKLGRLTPVEFYSYLVTKSKELRINLDKYKNLVHYIEYAKIYSTLKNEQLFKELDTLEDRIRGTLYQNDDQKELYRLSRNLTIIRNIFGITLTPDEYSYFKAHKDEFDIENYAKFVNRKASLHGFSLRLDNDILKLNDYLEKMQEFYVVSLKRDQAFLKNIKFGNRQKIAVIVTGGFHSENLADLFKKNSISYISIMPNFKNEDGYVSLYFKLLSGEKRIVLAKEVQKFTSQALAYCSPNTPLATKVDEVLSFAAAKDATQPAVKYTNLSISRILPSDVNDGLVRELAAIEEQVFSDNPALILGGQKISQSLSSQGGVNIAAKESNGNTVGYMLSHPATDLDGLPFAINPETLYGTDLAILPAYQDKPSLMMLKMFRAFTKEATRTGYRYFAFHARRASGISKFFQRIGAEKMGEEENRWGSGETFDIYRLDLLKLPSSFVMLQKKSGDITTFVQAAPVITVIAGVITESAPLIAAGIAMLYIPIIYKTMRHAIAKWKNTESPYLLAQISLYSMAMTFFGGLFYSSAKLALATMSYGEPTYITPIILISGYILAVVFISAAIINISSYLLKTAWGGAKGVVTFLRKNLEKSERAARPENAGPAFSRRSLLRWAGAGAAIAVLNEAEKALQFAASADDRLAMIANLEETHVANLKFVSQERLNKLGIKRDIAPNTAAGFTSFDGKEIYIASPALSGNVEMSLAEFIKFIIQSRSFDEKARVRTIEVACHEAYHAIMAREYKKREVERGKKRQQNMFERLLRSATRTKDELDFEIIGKSFCKSVFGMDINSERSLRKLSQESMQMKLLVALKDCLQNSSYSNSIVIWEEACAFIFGTLVSGRGLLSRLEAEQYVALDNYDTIINGSRLADPAAKIDYRYRLAELFIVSIILSRDPGQLEGLRNYYKELGLGLPIAQSIRKRINWYRKEARPSDNKAPAIGMAAALTGAAHEGRAAFEAIKEKAAQLEALDRKLQKREEAGGRTRKDGLERLLERLKARHTQADWARINGALDYLGEMLGLSQKDISYLAGKIYLINVGKAKKRLAIGQDKLGGVITRKLDIIFPRESLSVLQLSRLKDTRFITESEIRVLGDLLHEIIEVRLLESGAAKEEAHWYARIVQNTFMRRTRRQVENVIRMFGSRFRLNRIESELGYIVKRALHIYEKATIEELRQHDLSGLLEEGLNDIRNAILKELDRLQSHGIYIHPDFRVYVEKFITKNKLDGFMQKFKRFDSEDLIIILQRLYTLAADPSKFNVTKEEILRQPLSEIVIKIAPTNYQLYFILEKLVLGGRTGNAVGIEDGPSGVTYLLENGKYKEVLDRFKNLGPREEIPEFIHGLIRDQWLMDMRAIILYFGIDMASFAENMIMNAINDYNKKGVFVERLDENAAQDLRLDIRRRIMRRGIFRILEACIRLSENGTRIEKFVGRGAASMVFTGRLSDGEKVIVKINLADNPQAAGDMFKKLKAIKSSMERSRKPIPYFAEIKQLIITPVSRTRDVQQDIIEIDEYVEGLTLRRFMDTFTPKGALDAAIKVVRGARILVVAGAIDEDIDHLDNFVVTPEGDVKLVDYSRLTLLSELKPEELASRIKNYKMRLRLTLSILLHGRFDSEIDQILKESLHSSGKELSEWLNELAIKLVGLQNKEQSSGPLSYPIIGAAGESTAQASYSYDVLHSSRDAAEVVRIASSRHWYYRDRSEEETRAALEQRFNGLAPSFLYEVKKLTIEMIKEDDSIMNELAARGHVLGGDDIVTIAGYGSYWCSDTPSDLDLCVIVKIPGVRKVVRNIRINPDDFFKKDSTYRVDKIDIHILSEEYYDHAYLYSGAVPEGDVKGQTLDETMYWRDGIIIEGRDFWSAAPSARDLLENIYDVLGVSIWMNRAYNSTGIRETYEIARKIAKRWAVARSMIDLLFSASYLGIDNRVLDRIQQIGKKLKVHLEESYYMPQSKAVDLLLCQARSEIDKLRRKPAFEVKAEAPPAKSGAPKRRSFTGPTFVVDVKTGEEVASIASEDRRISGGKRISLKVGKDEVGYFTYKIADHMGHNSLMITDLWVEPEHQHKAGDNRILKYVGLRLIQIAAIISQGSEAAGAIDALSSEKNQNAQNFYETLKPFGLKPYVLEDGVDWYIEAGDADEFINGIESAINSRHIEEGGWPTISKIGDTARLSEEASPTEAPQSATSQDAAGSSSSYSYGPSDLSSQKTLSTNGTDGFVGGEYRYWTRYPFRLMQTLRKAHKEDNSKMLIVDLGCAAGHITTWTLGQNDNFRLLGLEKYGQLVSEAIENARRNGSLVIDAASPAAAAQDLLNSKKPAIAFKDADLSQGIPLEDNSVDAIIMDRLMHAFSEKTSRDKLLDEIARVLKPNGLLSLGEDLYVEPDDLEGGWYSSRYRVGADVTRRLINEGMLPDSYTQLLNDDNFHLILSLRNRQDERIDETIYDGKGADLVKDIKSGNIKMRGVGIHEKTEHLVACLRRYGFVVEDKKHILIPEGGLREGHATVIWEIVLQKREAAKAPTPAVSVEVTPELKQALDEALKKLSDRNPEDIKVTFQYIAGTYGTFKELLARTRQPEEPRYVFMPLPETLRGIESEADRKMMTNSVEKSMVGAREIAEDILKANGFTNVNIIFYDGTVNDLRRVISATSDKKGQVNPKNGLAYINKEELRGLKPQARESLSVSLVKENVPDGGGKFSVGGHVVLALGILDLLNNERAEDSDYWTYVLGLVRKLSNNENKYDGITKDKFMTKIYKEDLEIDLPPIEREHIDENMKTLSLVEKAVGTAM